MLRAHVAPVTRAAVRVAVVAVGDPASPATWSGITAGVLSALEELGVVTSAVDLAMPPALERATLVGGAARTLNRYDAESAALTMALRSRLARHRLRAASVDGVVQVGTTFALPVGLRYVTLEDMTLRQGAAIHPVFARMSTDAIAAWERRRAGIYARAHTCTVASHWTAGSLTADYGVEKERIAVVGLGANHVPAAASQERGWQTPHFLFVGIDWERKGGPRLLRAFARLRGAIPQATLDVVGGHPSISQPGVSGHGMLSLARAQDREAIARLFERATCFVMPSHVEPFGIAHVEAAAVGIPSIGSSVGGAREVIGEDGGVVVDPGDEAALFEAMHRLSDPAAARRMGDAARERARLYTWTRVAERLLRALGLPDPHGRELAEYL